MVGKLIASFRSHQNLSSPENLPSITCEPAVQEEDENFGPLFISRAIFYVNQTICDRPCCILNTCVCACARVAVFSWWVHDTAFLIKFSFMGRQVINLMQNIIKSFIFCCVINVTELGDCFAWFKPLLVRQRCFVETGFHNGCSNKWARGRL